jgi:hypothetical protein
MCFEKSEANGISDAPVHVGLADIDVRIALLAPDLEPASTPGKYHFPGDSSPLTMFVAQENAPLLVRRRRVCLAIELSNRHSLFCRSRWGFLNPLFPSIEL